MESPLTSKSSKQPTSFDTYNNDVAPIGEVVRTRVEGEDRDGREGPLFNNLRDLPLANDFPSSSSSQPDPTTPNPVNIIQTTQGPYSIQKFLLSFDIPITPEVPNTGWKQSPWDPRLAKFS